MNIDLGKAIDSKLDRTKWKKWKFSDLVDNIVEKVKPQESGLEHYIGLKHLDSGSLHIKRFGETESLIGDKLKIYKNDIIFAKRNAYLKRVSIAPFDAVVSAHSMVLRPKSENVLPEFLPFFLLSEQFWIRAIEISVGSLSPTINWKSLAKQEFLLPPKDQQAKLAELLWAMDNVIEKKHEFKEKANLQYEVAKSNLVLQGINKATEFSEMLKRDVAKNWKITTIGDLLKDNYILKIQDGNHGEIHPKSSDYVEEGIPFIMANTLIDGKIDFEKSKKLPKELTDSLRIGFAQSNDILLSHKGTVGEVAMVPEKINYPYLMLTPQVTFYRINPNKILNKFLYYVFNASYFQIQIERLSSQSTRAYVGITAQRGFKLAIPNSIEEQQEIVDVLSKVEENKKKIDRSISSSKALQKSLINQVF